MRSSARSAGVAALAFGVLPFVGMFIANPPGGTYSAHDAAKYLARGHHVAVFVSIYVFLLAIIGLIWLLAYLREVAFRTADAAWLGRLFWGTGLAGATALAVGWGVVLGVAAATAYGGHRVTLPANVTYMLVEAEGPAIWGAGCFLLGFALIALLVGARAMFPAWLRWATVIGAIGGITALAFFPSALLLLWGIAIGVWLLLAARKVAAPATAVG